jgi:predicted nucleic acid-binding protein
METGRVKVAAALSGVSTLFLDTAPVIYHVEGNAAFQDVTDAVFQAILQGSPRAVASSITLAECPVHPFRAGDLQLAQRFRQVLTAGVNTQYVGVDASTEAAAQLRAQYNLALTDAFQVAAALAAGCDAILTNDSGLKRVTEIAVLVLSELEP